MEKINVVLVVLNNKFLEQTIRSLSFYSANLVAIVVENSPKKFLKLGDKEIPLRPFSAVQNLIDADKNFIWLINGYINNVSDIWSTKKFLMDGGIPEENIVNFEILPHISVEWLANLRHVRKNGADFFATGISYTEVGLDLKCFPSTLRGVNLAGSNQDLRQSFLTAKYVFEHVKPGTIKFVLIGLTPYSFRYDNAKSFFVCSRNLQYMLGLMNSEPQTHHDFLLQTLVSNEIKNIFFTTTEKQADLNFERLKNIVNTGLTARALVNWEAELDNLTKKFYPQAVQKNFQILKAYIELCLANGAKPVGVVFPFAPAMRKNYNEELLKNFRDMIQRLEENYDFTCVDLFDLPLDYDCFYNMAHLNLKGSSSASAQISLRLLEKNILSTEDFCDTRYDYFELLSNVIPQEKFNSFLDDSRQR